MGLTIEFECVSCGHVYEASNGYYPCPKCGSPAIAKDSCFEANMRLFKQRNGGKHTATAAHSAHAWTDGDDP